MITVPIVTIPDAGARSLSRFIAIHRAFVAHATVIDMSNMGLGV
jgi:hypothetical protein